MHALNTRHKIIVCFLELKASLHLLVMMAIVQHYNAVRFDGNTTLDTLPSFNVLS